MQTNSMLELARETRKKIRGVFRERVDTIAGYYLTCVGTIPDPKERISYEVESQNKQLILTNDKVKNGRVTKVKVEISDIIEEAEKAEK